MPPPSNSADTIEPSGRGRFPQNELLPSLRQLRDAVRRFLEAVVIAIVAALSILVVVAAVLRKIGYSLVWYDEVAAVLLAWLTFYGAALAALHRAHIGFPKLVERLDGRPRRALFLLRKALVIGFFALTAWMGMKMMTVLGGTFLVSLPWLPARVVYSAIPAGAVLFVLAELLPPLPAQGERS